MWRRWCYCQDVADLWVKNYLIILRVRLLTFLLICKEVHKLDGVNDMNGMNKENKPLEMIIYTTEDGLAKLAVY